MKCNPGHVRGVLAQARVSLHDIGKLLGKEVREENIRVNSWCIDYDRDSVGNEIYSGSFAALVSHFDTNTI